MSNPTRRSVLMAATLASVLPVAAQSRDPLASLEARSGGRLGVAVWDSAGGRRLEYRAQERFPQCSTFKFLLGAAVLSRVEHGLEKPGRFIAYDRDALLPHSPVSQVHASAGGMTVAASCEAAVMQSDNTAANLLLASLGGPPGWTAYARSLGDTESRLDRTEMALNSAIPGDPRDTTTPHAMLDDMRKILLGDVLSAASRQTLERWMAANPYGLKRLRAGVPSDWHVADKTGTGERGTRNDIAILRPPGRAPILACVYFTGAPMADAAREAVIAGVGRIIAALF